MPEPVRVWCYDSNGGRLPGWVEGGKVYVICPRCKKVVRVNKPIIGSTHVCD